jgi:hypothetical protein
MEKIPVWMSDRIFYRVEPTDEITERLLSVGCQNLLRKPLMWALSIALDFVLNGSSKLRESCLSWRFGLSAPVGGLSLGCILV